MKLRINFLLLLLIVFSVNTFGQTKKEKYSKQKQSDTELLEEARAIQKEDPKYAISLVEQVLSNFNSKKKRKKSKKENSQKVEADAYTLLGDIYEGINQNELALKRYEQAMSVWRRSKAQHNQPESELYYRMARLHLKLGDDKSAEKNFKRCEGMTDDKMLRQLCEEGLADVELSRGNAVKSISQLESIEENYVLDSLSQSRINAKRSQVYTQQEDYSNANVYLDNSIKTLPKNKKLKKEDVESVEKARDDIYNSSKATVDEKIENASNYSNVEPSRANVEVPKELKIKENLQLATLYEEKEDFVKAEELVVISKAAIDKNTAAASVAEVYKKSADINRKKGAIDAALLDLEKYSAAREEAIMDLETELKKQIDIVKGQQKIDINKKDIDIEEKESELLSSQLQTQKIISGLLGLLLLASLVFFYFLNKNVKAKRKANQMLLVKSLRTQMNPHFIFNALNSVNNFIAKNDEKAANKFLSEFSRLMRKVLDYSQKDFISFEEEIELNELYLKLEHFRFRDKFEYEFLNLPADKEGNATVNLYDLEVPPMLIQPFIENAVWHGLRYKEGQGHLKISIEELGNELLVKIQDDGIGREKSKALKTKNQKKYKSTGLENVSKRIALINEIYEKNYKIEVSDVDKDAEETGTLVKIFIPK